MNTMLGAFDLAYLNNSLTLAAPKPTYISTNSEPLTEKNGTPASPAQAFASNVFPVPGGPVNKAPLGIRAPNFLYLLGAFKKSTNSLISPFASSYPATSLNLILIFCSNYFESILVIPPII